MLELVELSHRFGEVTALQEISARIPAGEFVSVLGPSGCGKSTLLNCVGGFVTPDSGTIIWNGTDITHLPAERRSFGVVFQDYALFPHMNVFENVAFALKARREPRDRIAPRVREMLSMVGLSGMDERYPGQLSGGQKQRVALARALAPEPRLLLLDEPLTALDRNLRLQLQEELHRLHQMLGLTVLFVTHDPEEAMSLSNRILLLQDGRIIQRGGPAELYADPASLGAMRYFGRLNEFVATVTNVGTASITVDVAEGLTLDIPRTEKTGHSAPSSGEEVVIALRPEDWQVSPLINNAPSDSAGNTSLSREVVDVIRRGAVVDLWLEGSSNERLIATLHRDEYDATVVRAGQKVLIRPKPGVVRYFQRGVE
ncbi:MAG: ATP-binding cassette domain-containing protein [Acidimicrobiia bacterium]|nr:ATP-binding cassette domain-containing protein [Acidimicrobiia bacterium]